MQNDNKLLQTLLDTEVFMTDLLTDIYAVNLAMYIEDNQIQMPDELKETGRKFLIDRNIAFMNQHMSEVLNGYQHVTKMVRESNTTVYPPNGNPVEIEKAG